MMYLRIDDTLVLEPIKSLDISYQDFVDDFPVRVILNGEYAGEYSVTHFEISESNTVRA